MKILIIIGMLLIFNSCAINHAYEKTSNYIGLTENEVLMRFGKPTSITETESHKKIDYTNGEFQREFLLNTSGKVYSYSSNYELRKRMTQETKGKLFVGAFAVALIAIVAVIMSVGQ